MVPPSTTSGKMFRARPGTLAVAAGLYSLLVVAAFVVAWIADEPSPNEVRPARLELQTSLVLALAVGAASAGVSLVADRVGFGRRLRDDLSAALGPIGPGDAAVLAACSAIGEEAFFRGALQPALGFWPATILFAVVHVGPKLHFLAWTAYAFVFGVAFALLFEASGGVFAPIVAHFSANYLGLLLLWARRN